MEASPALVVPKAASLGSAVNPRVKAMVVRGEVHSSKWVSVDMINGEDLGMAAEEGVDEDGDDHNDCCIIILHLGLGSGSCLSLYVPYFFCPSSEAMT